MAFSKVLAVFWTKPLLELGHRMTRRELIALLELGDLGQVDVG
jgi:hypothetical protein